jgi:hypothetical protein
VHGWVPFNYATLVRNKKAFVSCSIIAILPFKTQCAYVVYNIAHVRIQVRQTREDIPKAICSVILRPSAILRQYHNFKQTRQICTSLLIRKKRSSHEQRMSDKIFVSLILSRVCVTIDGVWIGN